MGHRSPDKAKLPSEEGLGHSLLLLEELTCLPCVGKTCLPRAGLQPILLTQVPSCFLLSLKSATLIYKILYLHRQQKALPLVHGSQSGSQLLVCGHPVSVTVPLWPPALMLSTPAS